MKRLVLLLALAPLTLPVSAKAQMAPKVAATQIDIPFAPPLDTPLRFRITQAKAKAGTAPLNAVWDEELRFVREGEGFIMHWRILEASLPPVMRAPPYGAMMAPFTGKPIAFDLDARGTLLRAREWDKTLPEILGIVD